MVRRKWHWAIQMRRFRRFKSPRARADASASAFTAPSRRPARSGRKTGGAAVAAPIPLLSQSGEPGTTDERIAVLTEIGDLHAGPLANPADALSSYREALSLSPKAVTIQHKLLSLYTEQQMWPEAADLLQELAAAETNEKRRARYKQTAGFITRDHLKEPRRALRLLWSSFDDDPSLVKASSQPKRWRPKSATPKSCCGRCSAESKSWAPMRKTPRNSAQKGCGCGRKWRASASRNWAI